MSQITSEYFSGGVFATACSDGVIRIFDARDTDKDAALVLAAHARAEPFHSVQFNPADSRLVVTSNNRQGIALWDVRRPRKIALRLATTCWHRIC